MAIQRAHIQALMNIKPVYNERDVRRLRELYHACETNCRGLKTLGVDESSYATIVVPEILDKLPESLRLTITRGASGSDFLSWTMKDILKALLDEIELREAHESFTTNTSKQERRKPQFLDGSAAALVNHTTREGRPRCVYCLQEHLSQDCKKIQDAAERKQILRKYGRCFICLKRGHISSDCLNTSKCSACSKRHHSSICESHANGSITADVVHSTHSCVGSANRVALQTAQALVMGGKENVRVRVMFDSGSQRSFVTGKVAQKAGVPAKRKEWVEIRTFGQEKVEGKLREVFELSVAPVQGGESVSIEVYGVDSISQIRNEHVETRKKDYPHLQGLWFSDVCKTKNVLEIELLIGADYLWLFQEGRTVRGKSDEPVAVQTKLGWVLSGPLKSSSEDDDGPTSCAQVSVNLIGHVTSSKNRSLEACVEKLWDYETLGIKHEEEASELLNYSIHFNGQRYSVSLPWKEGHSLLPTNYSCSVQRLKGQLLRLKKEPEVLQEYDRVIKEQLELGIIEPVVELERADKIHYLPHHAVVRKDAKTTKVRVVYDASSKETKKGVSLNDCLHVGPPLSPLLYHIILRFREKRIALVADIEDFLNIEIDPCDRVHGSISIFKKSFSISATSAIRFSLKRNIM
ncbi:E3 ubiquitin- ligase DZIP3 [Paramuricea clavata]|uniref:E3 ubiquitin- ligase DZIP3 n=1 Tax=Paramuricea clavata TaxID=317549 RepID=A0A7D9D6X6_PARCT|nr:E3 ubiquitin- ligase DZIP3 [Paramuricea clavata]